MVHAGCVFVVAIHPSRKWMSGSFESVQWNACVHRLDLCLYSHQKEFWGNGVGTHINCKVKIPSTRKKSPQRRIKPTRLHKTGHRALHTTNELFRPPLKGLWTGVFFQLSCDDRYHCTLHFDTYFDYPDLHPKWKGYKKEWTSSIILQQSSQPVQIRFAFETVGFDESVSCLVWHEFCSERQPVFSEFVRRKRHPVL